MHTAQLESYRLFFSQSRLARAPLHTLEEWSWLALHGLAEQDV